MNRIRFVPGAPAQVSLSIYREDRCEVDSDESLYLLRNTFDELLELLCSECHLPWHVPRLLYRAIPAYSEALPDLLLSCSAASIGQFIDQVVLTA